MPVAPQLRPYRPADRTALEAFARETVDDGTVYPFESVDGVLDYFLGAPADVAALGGAAVPPRHVVVAEVEGRVAGVYVVKPVQPDRGAHVANAGYVVGEAFRGRGLGRALGEHSLTVARQLGYRAMQFNYVVKSNVAAVRLWQRLGFRIVAELPGAFRHPDGRFLPVHVMYRALD